MLQVLLTTLSKHNMAEQILISSFDPFIIGLMKEVTNYRKGLINGFPQLDNCHALAPSIFAASDNSSGRVRKNCLNKNVAVAEAIRGKVKPA